MSKGDVRGGAGDNVNREQLGRKRVGYVVSCCATGMSRAMDDRIVGGARGGGIPETGGS